MVTLKDLPSLKTNMEPEDGSQDKGDSELGNLHFLGCELLVLRGVKNLIVKMVVHMGVS